LGSGLSLSDLDEYEADFAKFAYKVRNWAHELPNLLGKFGSFLPISIEIRNDGDLAAERTHVEAELHGDCYFIPLNFFDDLFKRAFKPPEPPKPLLASIANIPPIQFHPESKRVDVFYAQDVPGTWNKTTLISWRCEELRQGTRHELRALIATRKPSANGNLVVRASGALVAATVTQSIPFVQQPSPPKEPFWRYISTRLELLPRKYHSALLS